MRRRLDSEIVRRGLASDNAAARRLIDTNRILVNGAPTTNPARQVGSDESISYAKESSRFVGRGGEKLEGALEELGVTVKGHRVLDAGASTGGFTEAVLQRGANEVVAVDVGRGQLHERLRRDPRVTIRDRTNIRLVGPEELGQFDTVVADLSFISLSVVMTNLVACTVLGGQLVLLVKPQFEAERQETGHNGGVISDPEQWRSAVESIVRSGLANGAETIGMCVSPLRGADGNVEFFLHMRSDTDGSGHAAGQSPTTTLSAMIDKMIQSVRTTIGRGDTT